jgi:hypothetical protein
MYSTGPSKYDRRHSTHTPAFFPKDWVVSTVLVTSPLVGDHRIPTPHLSLWRPYKILEYVRENPDADRLGLGRKCS